MLKMYLTFLFICLALASASPFDNRIVGGNDASEGQFPYQISIQRNKKHGCGGTIIDKNWILTAAHCTNGQVAENLEVVAGITNLKDTSGQRIKVAKIIQNNDFVQNSEVVMINDISLLKLADDLTFNSKVQPINLNRNSVGSGASAILSGWGYTKYPSTQVPNNLQYINLKTITNDECANYHENVQIIDSEICTFTKLGEGGCRGDSGGPLVSGNELIGVVSWGTPCAKGVPDIYTRVSDFIDWIEENMQ